LRHGLPQARISLVGLPWARALCERLDSVDEFIEFPGWPGLPERPPPDVQTGAAFISSLRTRQADLALQMHGSGGIVNPLVASFGAARMAGFAVPGFWPWDGPWDEPCSGPDSPPTEHTHGFVHWPHAGSEVERLLALTDHLGLPRQGVHLDFPLRDEDRTTAAALRRTLGARDHVLLHPGAQLPSRRWAPQRFAAVADALAEEGLGIVITGSPAEAPLARAVCEAMRAPAVDVSGMTSLWTLGALVEGARLVLTNDTGLSHIAAALRRPSVIVASGSDVARWAPADTALHRVLWHDLPCRPCAHAMCPISGHPCAQEVTVGSVRDAAQRMLALHATPQPRALPA